MIIKADHCTQHGQESLQADVLSELLGVNQNLLIYGRASKYPLVIMTIGVFFQWQGYVSLGTTLLILIHSLLTFKLYKLWHCLVLSMYLIYNSFKFSLVVSMSLLRNEVNVSVLDYQHMKRCLLEILLSCLFFFWQNRKLRDILFICTFRRLIKVLSIGYAFWKSSCIFA